MTEHSTTGSIVLLTRLARVVYRGSPESLLGIRLKELGVLAYLRDSGRVSQQALAEGLCTDANTCVLLLNLIICQLLCTFNLPHSLITLDLLQLSIAVHTTCASAWLVVILEFVG